MGYYNSILRKAIYNLPVIGRDSVFVVEHPKSGGTWLGQLLSEYLSLPFMRNRSPIVGSRQIMHCHEIARPYLGKRNCVILFRDGRDVVVSYYYHSLFINDIDNAEHVRRVSKYLNFKDKNDIYANLTDFIEFLYDSNKYPKLTWARFVNSWNNPSNCIVRYENLLTDPLNELKNALITLGENQVDESRLENVIEQYSFKNQKMIHGTPGNQSSQWLRSGVAGAWKKYFSKQSAILFNELAGEQLVALGYESDNDWVASIK